MYWELRALPGYLLSITTAYCMHVAQILNIWQGDNIVPDRIQPKERIERKQRWLNISSLIEYIYDTSIIIQLTIWFYFYEVDRRISIIIGDSENVK